MAQHPTKRTLLETVTRAALYTGAAGAVVGAVIMTHKSKAIIERFSSQIPAILCGVNPATWIQNELVTTTALPWLKQESNSIIVAVACALLYLVSRRLSSDKATGGIALVRGFLTTFLTALALTGFIAVATSFLRTHSGSSANASTGSLLDAPFACQDVAARLQLAFASKTNGSAADWIDLLVRPPPLESPAVLAQAVNAVNSPLGEIALNIYARIYPPLMYILRNFQPYLVYAYLGLGAVWALPPLERVFHVYEVPMAMLAALLAQLSFHKKSLDIEKFTLPSIQEATHVGLEYFVFFGLAVCGLTVIKMFARVSSRRAIIPAVVSVWVRAHDLGLPWLGLHFESFCVAFLLVALFSSSGASPGLFLVFASVAKLFPALLPRFPPTELYLAVVLVYHAVLSLFEARGSAATGVSKKKKKKQAAKKKKE